MIHRWIRLDQKGDRSIKLCLCFLGRVTFPVYLSERALTKARAVINHNDEGREGRKDEKEKEDQQQGGEYEEGGGGEV